MDFLTSDGSLLNQFIWWASVLSTVGFSAYRTFNISGSRRIFSVLVLGFGQAAAFSILIAGLFLLFCANRLEVSFEKLGLLRGLIPFIFLLFAAGGAVLGTALRFIASRRSKR